MIKKFFLHIFLVAMVLFTSAKAFAATEEQIPEGADLTTIKRLAVAYPRHYKLEKVDDEPSIDMLIEMLDNASKSTNFEVVPYAAVVINIKKDTNVDITELEYNELQKAFEDNIANYADAYVTLTTANGIDPTMFLFKIQNAKTGDIMYLLKISSRSFTKNARGYNSACELFYKTLDVAISKAAKGK